VDKQLLHSRNVILKHSDYQVQVLNSVPRAQLKHSDYKVQVLNSVPRAQLKLNTSTLELYIICFSKTFQQSEEWFPI